jgi:hypothetical protein
MLSTIVIPALIITAYAVAMTGAPVTRNPAFCLAESWAVGHGEGMGDSAVYKTFVDHCQSLRLLGGISRV